MSLVAAGQAARGAGLAVHEGAGKVLQYRQPGGAAAGQDDRTGANKIRRTLC